MKKTLFKVLLPITALLLSSCTFVDWVKDRFFNEPEEQVQKEEKETETPAPEPEPIQVSYPNNPTNIEIPETLPLTIGSFKELSVTYTPSNAKNKSVEWSSSDTSIATVINGKITGISAGFVTITASAKDRKGETITSECNVAVTDPSLISKTTLNYTYDDYMSNTIYAMDNCPLVGNPKLLVIPIWFNDSTDFINMDNREIVRDDIRKAFFGTNTETGWRSVKTFYEEESKGIMSFDGTVADWYETNESYINYISGYDTTETLVDKATTSFFNSHSRKEYDTNNDGYLDGVLLIYAAPDCDNLGYENTNNLWAYTSWLQTAPFATSPVPNVFFWGSYDFMYSAGMDSYEKTGETAYGRGDTRHCKVDAHCFIHEMGHVLGLSDYYDYSGQHSPAGGFSMQDYNVGGHDAYSVISYGWANPYIPTETTTITINDFQSSHDVILLANHEVDSPFDEYLLLELYSPTGLNEHDSEYTYNDRYPTGPKNVGIRLWHVDARLAVWTNRGWSSTLTSNPTVGNVYHATSNTYSDYTGLALGKDYNLLQLIKRDGVGEMLSNGALFYVGQSFRMSDYSNQFVKSQRMNNGENLGWTFTVGALDNTSAAITVTKL